MDCGFLYLSAKRGALFFWKEDGLAKHGKHGVCMDSACIRSLWGGNPIPRTLLGEYYARYGICPPCATKSTRSISNMLNVIPSEDQRAERKQSREAPKRMRNDRGGGRSGWASQPSGGHRASWGNWTASDGNQPSAASTGGAVASDAAPPTSDSAGPAVPNSGAASLSSQCPPPQPPVLGLRQCHTWSETRQGGRRICRVCFRTSRLSQPPASEKCHVLRQKLLDLIADRQGYNLACCDFPGGILIFCTKCGGVTEGTRLATLVPPGVQ